MDNRKKAIMFAPLRYFMRLIQFYANKFGFFFSELYRHTVSPLPPPPPHRKKEDKRFFNIYRKISQNFAWNVNGKINFVSLKGKFLDKMGFVSPKLPKQYPYATVRSICLFLLVPGLLVWIALDR